MDFPIHINTISMDLSILYFKGTQVKITNFNTFLYLKIILANSADSDEMPHYMVFHLGLHRLP